MALRLGIKGFCVWVSSLPLEKQQLLMIWINLKFTNFSKKARTMVVSRANKRAISIHQTGISRGARYLPNIILSGNIERGCQGQLTTVSKDLGHKMNRGFTKVYFTTWLTWKLWKKYCHDTPKEVKAWDMHNLNLINYSKLISLINNFFSF